MQLKVCLSCACVPSRGGVKERARLHAYRLCCLQVHCRCYLDSPITVPLKEWRCRVCSYPPKSPGDANPADKGTDPPSQDAPSTEPSRGTSAEDQATTRDATDPANTSAGAADTPTDSSSATNAATNSSSTAAKVEGEGDGKDDGKAVTEPSNTSKSESAAEASNCAATTAR